MKSKLLILCCISVFNFSFSQMKITEREDLSKINKNWRLTKTHSGTYGISDKSGKIIVQPVYSRINKFGEYADDLALVKNIAGTYGFINRSGTEIIPAHYELDYLEKNFSVLKKKYIQ
ncbi:KWG Leptospira [Chryseobacterium gleum]|uniref:KWG Leptospira n=2 Tax=Chryseobacterium gleum TaxID=250 RepID=A0A3S4MGZ1_CHRGE|nr:WG repeat-containing protein [Chryseobacterium gleum]MCE4064078.1 WG repeat-containing protein [Chryseobacterium gleum]QQY34793.1 WG repeat-containing protein [Chryseobacterium gleum]VEE11689.1 KWG Leptospira [Chryseobacterium gleum]